MTGLEIFLSMGGGRLGQRTTREAFVSSCGVVVPMNEEIPIDHHQYEWLIEKSLICPCSFVESMSVLVLGVHLKWCSAKTSHLGYSSLFRYWLECLFVPESEKT
jgi:hypothetical protein